MDGWIAYRLVEQRESWQQVGVIASTIHNDLEVIKKYLNNDHKPKMTKAEDFMPRVKKDKARLTRHAIGEALRRRWGN